MTRPGDADAAGHRGRLAAIDSGGTNGGPAGTPSAASSRRAPEPFPRPLAHNGLRSQDGPLIARHHVGVPAPIVGPPPKGRVARFVSQRGWRALVIPVLIVATFVTLLDVVSKGTAAELADVGVTTTAPTNVISTGPSPADPDLPTAEGEGPLGEPPLVALVPFVEQGTGQLSVVPGVSPVYGTGPLQRFIIEVEDGINVDGVDFAAAVEATLADPRSWGAGGEQSFQRVDGGAYDFRVSLVSPLNVESFCPGVGTGGYTSCRYGERAVINLARWESAVPDYEGDVATYRLYVVNHEVGHLLGNGHKPCPGPGELAPAMQQQTLGLEGCLKNPWPFPNG